MTEQDDAPTTEETDGPRVRKRPLFPVRSALFVALVVAVVLPGVSTLAPGYYERYDDLASRMDNWRASTHARIPCSGCHIEPGLSGYLTYGARSVPAFYSQLVFGPAPTNLFQVPTRAACQKCHTSYRQVSASGDLLIPHKAHVEVLRLACAVCHKDLVHTRTPEGFNEPKMSTCLTLCHDDVKATNSCAKCHTAKQVPESHKTVDWLRVHSSRTETTDCGRCHAWSPDYCGKCHAKRPRSHAGNWKREHQVRARVRGPKGCLSCHGSGFCKECH